MAIDAHAHWRPPGLIDAMRARNSEPRVVRNAKGVEVMRKGGTDHSLATAFDDPEVRIAEMDRLGISASLLSMLLEFAWIEHLPLAESIPLVQRYNDSVSDLCAAHPDRFAAYASVPLTDLSAAAEELDRAMRLPGIIGAQVPGNGFLSLQAAEAFRPLMEVVDEHAAVILIHNNPLPGDPWPRWPIGTDNVRVRNGTLQGQSNLSAVMITLCLTDYLDQYPRAGVHVHNLGGNIPLEVERMDHRSLEDHPDAVPPSVRFAESKVFLDCNSFGAFGIEAGVRTYGEDRILFGTDGSAFGAAWSIEAIGKARISDEAKLKILSRNAQRMVSPLVALRG